uniref:FAM192A_Fyv6_N domain-containing protein n=1 Tax=Meloidogyne hapla TaxID=6305 RepID=A0A1I8BGM3_MELHA
MLLSDRATVETTLERRRDTPTKSLSTQEIQGDDEADERQKAFQEFKRKEEELLKFKEEGRTAENGNLIYSYYQKKYDDLAEKYEFEKQIKPKGQLEKLSSFSSATIPSEHSSAKPRGHVETKKENLGENSSSKPDGHFKTKKDPKVVKGNASIIS